MGTRLYLIKQSIMLISKLLGDFEDYIEDDMSTVVCIAKFY